MTGAAQPRVPAVRTNACQRSCSPVRHAPSRAGSTRRATGTSRAIASTDSRIPAPTAASAATPRTVASASPASTGRRSRRPAAAAAAARSSGRRRRAASATGVVRRDLADDVRHAPGDPLECGTGDVCPGASRRRSRRSPRARIGHPPRRPEPGERGQHPDAAASSTVARQRAEVGAGRRPGRARRASQSSIAPGGEHAAVERERVAAADPPGDRRQQPAARSPGPAARPGVREHEDAGPVGRLHAARRSTQPAPASAACWSHARARQRHVDRPGAVRAASPSAPVVSPIGGSTSPGTPKRSSSHGSQPRRRARAAACATRSTRRLRSPHRAGRRGTRRRCPSAACRAPARRATASSWRSSQASLPAEKYGSSGSPVRRRISCLHRARQPDEDRLRALVLPDDRRASAARPVTRVPRQHRLALVVQTAGDDRAAARRASTSSTVSTTAAQDLERDPSRPSRAAGG